MPIEKPTSLINYSDIEESNRGIEKSNYLYNTFGIEDEEPDIEENKRNFFDSMGTTYKQAYNQSLGGMMHEMMTGKKYYDLTLAPPSLTRDIAAGFLSFFASKEDIALLGASIFTGGTASAVTRAGVKAAVSTTAKKRAALMLAKRGGLDAKGAKKLIDNVTTVGMTQGAILAGHDGLYSAAKEARDKMLNEDFDFDKYKDKSYGEVLKEVTGNIKFKKFIPGAALGLGAAGTRTIAATRLAKKIPEGRGAGFAQSGLTYEMATFATVSPIMYEGRAPGFQDYAVAGGILMGLKLPGAVFGRAKSLAKQRLADEIETTELKRTAAIANEAKARREGRGGRLIYTQAIPTRLKGTEIIRKSVDDKDGKKKTVKTLGEEKVLFDRKLGGEVKIVDGSIKHTKKGTTMEIDVISGTKDLPVQRQYKLNERQTQQFFRTFVDEDTGLDIFTKEGGLSARLKKKLIRGDRNLFDTFYETEIKNTITKVKNQTGGYVKEDLDNAYSRAATEFSVGREKGYVHPLQLAVDSGKAIEFDVKNLTTMEKRYLGQYLAEERAIRKFVLDESTNNNFMYQTTGFKDKGIFSRMLGPLKPFYYELTHPVARKINRLLNNTNRNVQQKTAQRLLKMDGVLKIARGQNKENVKWYDNYIDGISGFGKQDTAFNDYKTIRRKTLELKEAGEYRPKSYTRTNKDGTKTRVGANTGYHYLTRKIKKQIDLTSNPIEKQNLQNRLAYLRQTKKITDEVYQDARGVLTNIAPYEAGYAPLMYRREVLDILYDKMRPMQEKVEQILKENGIHGQNADGTYPEHVREQLVEMVQRTVKSFSGKKGKGDVEFTRVWKALKGDTSRAGGDFMMDDLDLFRALDMQMYQRALRPFSPLERQRVNIGNLKLKNVDLIEFALRTKQEGILEQNMRNLFGEYISGASKRIELARTFTSSGEYYNQLLKKIPENLRMSGRNLPKAFGGQKLPVTSQTEREAVDLIKQVFTGEINFNKTIPAAETFQTVANLEMIGKIALGFAVIPNLTQTFISTTVEAGFLNTMKSIVRVAVGKDRIKARNMVRESGSTILNAFDEMLMTNSALQIGAARTLKYGDATTSWTRNFMDVNNARDGIALATQVLAKPFSAINTLNQTIAASTAETTIMKLTKILSGKKTGLGVLDSLAPNKRKAWARDKLKRMGLKEKDVIKHADKIINGNYKMPGDKVHWMKDEVLRSMQKFSTQSQLQRDFMLDPYLFNDPYIKPLLLFKRFGYRQAMYSASTIERELMKGNILPILNLGIGGMAGGQFVMWAKEKASELLSGEPQYYGKENRMKELRKPEWQDFKNALANVGSCGVMSDIMTDDDPISSIKFFLKPVMIDDFQRVVRSFDTFVGSMQTQYPDNWDVPFRKALIVAAPIAGGMPSRVIRTAETEKMRKDRVRGKKRQAVKDIKDLIIQGNSVAAARLMNEFNEYAVGDAQKGLFGGDLKQHEYFSLIITPDDVSYSALIKDWVDRLEALEEEKTKTF